MAPVRGTWLDRLLFVLGMVGSAGALAQQICLPAIPESTPTSAFVLDNEGTATHLATGLMWKRCAEGQTWDGAACTGAASTYTWQGALQQGVAGSTFAGHSDWRVPNIKELRSIVENRCYDPAFNNEVFPPNGAVIYWSASPYAGNNLWAWGVHVHGTAQYYNKLPGGFQLRLVRTAGPDVPLVVLTVAKSGAGTGTVTSVPSGINCGVDCVKSYASATAVALTAAPTGGALFTGWLGGGCTGSNVTCNVPLTAATSVTATFAPAGTTLSMDVDGSTPVTRYDALTDGLLVLRYLSGLSGASLTTGALGANAALNNPTLIINHLNDIRPLFDVDGNGAVEASTDGLMLLRYLFGLRGSALIAGAIGAGAKRTLAESIEAYIQTLLP